MPRKRFRDRIYHRLPPGAPPGTLVIDPAAPRPVITVFGYNAEKFVEQTIDDARRAGDFLKQWPVTWVNVDGLGDANVLQQLGDVFGLHRLALEDVVNVNQRAKVEPYGDHLYIVARMVQCPDKLLETEQVSIFLGKNFVLTFQQDVPGDCFDPIRKRLRADQSRLRALGSDYLAYALLDAVIDGYFPVLEVYGERLETLADEILIKPRPHVAVRLHEIKRDLLTLRRAIWPFREACNILQRDPTPLIKDETRTYLRDCYDHTVQIVDLVETYRELGSDLMDLYLSSVSNRMNEVMKYLTIFSTIFMPLSFIASLYGMNFDTDKSPWNMPELHWYYGYPFVLLVMAATAAGLVIFCWRKGWFTSATPTDKDEK